MDNEVMDLIEALYSMVSEAWGVPLGNDKCAPRKKKRGRWSRSRRSSG